MPTPHFEIYTDGACSGNPGPGGTGAVFLLDGIPLRTLSRGYRHTTNNRMEILAAAQALTLLRQALPQLEAEGFRETDVKVTVWTDSQLVVGTMADGWRRRSNKDLWEQLDEAVRRLQESRPDTRFSLSFRKVAGHAGDRYNEQADRLAVAASMNPTEEDSAYEDIALEKTLDGLSAEELSVGDIILHGHNRPGERWAEVCLTNASVLKMRPGAGVPPWSTPEQKKAVQPILDALSEWLSGGEL